MSGAASATDGDFAVLVAELRRCGSKRLVSHERSVVPGHRYQR